MLATQKTGTAALRHQDSSPASAREASSEPREFTGRKVKVPHGPETWFGFTRTPILASTEGGKLFAAASFERVKMPSGGKQMLLQDVAYFPKREQAAELALVWLCQARGLDVPFTPGNGRLPKDVKRELCDKLGAAARKISFVASCPVPQVEPTVPETEEIPAAATEVACAEVEMCPSVVEEKPEVKIEAPRMSLFGRFARFVTGRLAGWFLKGV